ncbi:35173_t:CDS:2, partial [Racocetra persica]
LESSGITILLGMEFDDPEVTLLAEQKNRDLVKDLEEEYRYATNQALNLDRKDFEAMQEYEQRILMERFTRQMKQYENKMHDIEDEEE